MWIILACVALGMSGLAPAGRSDGDGVPATPHRAVLEIMSTAPGDLGLRLEHHWGGIHAKYVYLDGQEGPFEAVVEATAGGVRVTFEGWEAHPFAAAAAELRVAYRRPGAGRADFVASAMPGGEVRVRAAGRPPVQGKKVTVRLGGPAVRYLPRSCRGSGTSSAGGSPHGVVDSSSRSGCCKSEPADCGAYPRGGAA